MSAAAKPAGSRWASTLLGSVITAAFIGPGTVTTCARAGVEFRYALLWALLVATIACFVLQEAVVRLTTLSGKTLGAALRRIFGESRAGRATLLLVVGSVVLGCAAYQAGNLLGGVVGLELALGGSRGSWTGLSIIVVFLLLWSGRTRWVSMILASLVALMGFAFLITAARLAPALGPLITGLVVPAMPDGSLLLVLGLVGTTVVPYNLFLGSGLAEGRSRQELYFGLAVAIGLGGLISMAIVVAGAAVEGGFSYAAVAGVLSGRLGPWAGELFGWGLFAAGFSSAITAPWAAALAVRSAFAQGADDPRYATDAWRWRATWLGVLAFGAAFCIAGAPPVPVILLAQAANGLILPIAAVALYLALGDRRLLGDAVDGPGHRLVTGGVVLFTVGLGLRGLLGALAAAFAAPVLQSPASLGGGMALALLALAVWHWAAQHRR
jgi:manganese transport protein